MYSGNVDLTTPFPFFGKTELEVLAVLGSFLLVAMHTITAACTKERVVVATKYAPFVGLLQFDPEHVLAAVLGRAFSRSSKTSGTTSVLYLR